MSVRAVRASAPEAGGPKEAGVSSVAGGIVLWLTLWLCCPALLAETVAPPSSTQALFWKGDATEARAAYESQVIQMALEKSRDRYGAYEYRMVTIPLSQERAEREVRDGELLNIISSPVWIAERSNSPVIIIPIPVAKGLLGHRRLVVRKQDLATFTAIRSRKDLQTLVAGLGRGWVDAKAFRKSDLPKLEIGELDQLLQMLARGRFDYLPLGVNEAQGAVQQSVYQSQLTVAPNLLLFYPLPVLIQVSVRRPVLARRLEYGLKQAQHDGSLDRLFNEHYGPVLQQIRSPHTRLIRLQAPTDSPGFPQPEPLTDDHRQ